MYRFRACQRLLIVAVRRASRDTLVMNVISHNYSFNDGYTWIFGKYGASYATSNRLLTQRVSIGGYYTRYIKSNGKRTIIYYNNDFLKDFAINRSFGTINFSKLMPIVKNKYCSWRDHMVHFRLRRPPQEYGKQKHTGAIRVRNAAGNLILKTHCIRGVIVGKYKLWNHTGELVRCEKYTLHDNKYFIIEQLRNFHTTSDGRDAFMDEARDLSVQRCLEN